MAIMRGVKVGTRLTVVLLAALTPLMGLYMFWTIRVSSHTYVEGMKRETRSITRSLRVALYNDVETNEWAQVHGVLRYLADQGTVGMVFDKRGRLWLAPSGSVDALMPSPERFLETARRGEVEYQSSARGNYWFCRLVPLRLGPRGSLGFLLVAQNWTAVHQAMRAQVLDSGLRGVGVVILVVLIVTLGSRAYVSRPLAELARRVSNFANADTLTQRIFTDEVALLTEEFRRLDDALTTAHNDLLAQHRHELELERRLRHSDKLATIGTLASGLAHEIGTPLGVIRGRAEYLLNQRPEWRKAADGLHTIISQIDRVSRIVWMLLDFARRGEPNRVRSDLRPIIMRAVHLIETEAARRGVELALGLGARALEVDCDVDQLQQVFVNLGMNALDAMADAGGRLTITAAPARGRAPATVSVAFSDTGRGVAAEDRERIFDPFFTTKEPGKGTGMGLAVSQTIAREHDGEIALEPASAGARFVVTLPLSADSAPQALAATGG